jgi:chromosome segregation ATPase
MLSHPSKTPHHALLKARQDGEWRATLSTEAKHERIVQKEEHAMSRDQLRQWKQETRERIDQLAKYDTTLRTVEGRLGQLSESITSSLTHMAGERQEYRELQTHLRETKKAFHEEFPDVPATPGGIEKAMRHAQEIVASIDRQLENETPGVQREEHPPTEAGWSELVAEASKNRAPEPPQEQQTPQKRPLLDLYLPEMEAPEQPDQEQERSR